MLCLVAQSCPTLCDPMGCSLPSSSVLGDSPGKNTGVGCNFLLQCVKVKSESEVAQSYPTLSDPTDCSLPTPVFLGFPGDSDGKESTSNAGDLGSIPGSGRCPGGGHGNPLQYSCLENPHGQRSVVGYSPWCRKESDMTERLSTAQHRHY